MEMYYFTYKQFEILCVILQKHTFTTVAAMILPALAPAGTIPFEEGPYFIHRDVWENMLEISPDGFIKIPAHKPTNEFGTVWENMKCPYPVEKTICVHYNTHVCYALQLLCQMKVKNLQKCWYASYSIDSVVVLELKFQDQIWGKCSER